MGGAATSSAVNAALVAQAAQNPGDTSTTGVAPATAAPAVQAQPAPFAQNTYFGGVNPFRQSAPTTQTAGGFLQQPSGPAPVQSPTLRMPGMQGVANPFYRPQASQPTTTRAPSQASNLAAQYQNYTAGYNTQLAQAADQRRADALAAQQLYEKTRAENSLRAEYEKKMADMQAQQQQMYSDSNSGSWGYAHGGIASLQQGFKR